MTASRSLLRVRRNFQRTVDLRLRRLMIRRFASPRPWPAAPAAPRIRWRSHSVWQQRDYCNGYGLIAYSFAVWVRKIQEKYSVLHAFQRCRTREISHAVNWKIRELGRGGEVKENGEGKGGCERRKEREGRRGWGGGGRGKRGKCACIASSATLSDSVWCAKNKA